MRLFRQTERGDWQGVFDRIAAEVTKLQAKTSGRQAITVAIAPHHNNGVALLAQGRLEEAMAAFREAIRVKPDHANAHNNLGVALIKQGRWQEAMASFREAIRLNPKFAGRTAIWGAFSGSRGGWKRR